MKTITSIFVVAYFLSSCSSPRYVYSAATQNIPVLQEKGDSKAALYYGSGGAGGVRDIASEHSYSRGIDLQGAYAVTNHFAMMLNYYWRSEGNGNEDSGFNMDDPSSLKYKRALIELGAGYYKALGESRQFYFQGFAGVAFGKFRIDDTNTLTGGQQFHQSKITKLFIQPALMLMTGDNFTSTISTRFNVVYYNNITTSYTTEQLHNYILDSLGSAKTFLEPAIGFTFFFNQLPGVRFESQFSFPVLTSKQYVDYRGFNFGLGVAIDFRKLQKKIK